MSVLRNGELLVLRDEPQDPFGSASFQDKPDMAIAGTLLGR